MNRPELHALVAEGTVPLDLPPGTDPATILLDVPHGVYEAARTFGRGRLFRLEPHLARMEHGERLSGLVPTPQARVREALADLLEAYGSDAKVRWDRLARPTRVCGVETEFLVALWPLELPPAELYRDGIAAGLWSDLPRVQPERKCSAWAAARDRRLVPTPEDVEPILVDGEGRLLEGARSNLVLVREGELFSAPRVALPGVTLGAVEELAGELGLPFHWRGLTVQDVPALEEAFFTTSIRSLVPVVRIDGRAVGDGRPGAITRRLSEAYAQRARERACSPRRPAPASTDARGGGSGGAASATGER